MAINYYLQPNAITSDPDDHSARIMPRNSLELPDLVSEMLRRGTTVTETDAQAVVTLFMEVIIDKVMEGNNVNIPIANIRPGIKGVFNDANDRFDPTRHTIRATLSGGSQLDEALRQASTEKVSHHRTRPELTSYFDYNSQSSDSILTPGGIGEITGDQLKFDKENAQEGIFFIDSSGTETQVEVLSVRTNGRLMFQVPSEMPAGDYTLEVRRAYGNNGDLRTGELIQLLTINPVA